MRLAALLQRGSHHATRRSFQLRTGFGIRGVHPVAAVVREAIIPIRPLLLASLLAIGLGASSGFAQTTIQNTTYASGQNVTVADSTIAANTNVTVSGGAVVKFKAGTSITLGPGFTASAGSSFRAFVFVDSDGDGMDDAWESAHGLDPTINDAAGHADGDGVSNLAEYLLGSNPNSTAGADSSNTTQLKVHRPQ